MKSIEFITIINSEIKIVNHKKYIFKYNDYYKFNHLISYSDC